MTEHDISQEQNENPHAPNEPASETDEVQTEARDSQMNTDAETAEAQEQSTRNSSEFTEEDTRNLLDKLAKEHGRLKDQLLRNAADFDNFRKRTKRDLQQAEIKGKESALQELLPVIDNLERAVQAASDTSDARSLIEGVQMVLRLFEDGARRLGIERIATIGEPFDPSVHEALQQQESAEAPPGTILEEIQPGYVLGERVLRAALVVVAKAAKDRPSEEQLPESLENTDSEQSGSREEDEVKS